MYTSDEQAMGCLALLVIGLLAFCFGCGIGFTLGCHTGMVNAQRDMEFQKQHTTVINRK